MPGTDSSIARRSLIDTVFRYLTKKFQRDLDTVRVNPLHRWTIFLESSFQFSKLFLQFPG